MTSEIKLSFASKHELFLHLFLCSAIRTALL
jgi:hypothetical protein